MIGVVRIGRQFADDWRMIRVRFVELCGAPRHGTGATTSRMRWFKLSEMKRSPEASMTTP